MPVAIKEAPDWLKDFCVDHVTVMVSDQGVKTSSDDETSDDDERRRHFYAVRESKTKVNRVTDDQKQEDRSNEQRPVFSQRFRSHLQRTTGLKKP